MKTIEDIIREFNLKITALSTNSVNFEQEEGNNEIKCSSYLSDFTKGKIEGMREAKKLLEEVKQLDEPQKPVVPKFVAEWFEENKDNLEFAIWELCVDPYNAEAEPEIIDWIQCTENKPIETIIRMKDGYEVEKEPLYIVELPSITPSKLVYDEDYCKYRIVGDYTIGCLRHHLTEKEIKAFDERYWPFAVPVKEVAEG